MKVLIINTVSLNTGDSAILQALLLQVEEAWSPDEVIVHDSHPEAAQQLYDQLKIRRCLSKGIRRRGSLEQGSGRVGQALRGLRFRAAVGALRLGLKSVLNRLMLPDEAQALQDYADADVIITTGGTYLVEHYNVWARIRTFRIAAVFKKALVFYTQSMGPFTQSAVRAAIKESLDYAALVLLRDKRSLEYLNDIGVKNANIHVVADSAFALTPPQLGVLPHRERPRVAISVREWQHFANETAQDGMARYTAAICHAVTKLVRKYQAEVVFLSTCQGVEAYGRDDSAVALSMVQKLSADVRYHVQVDREFYTPDAFMRELGGCAMMISTRMHGAIMGLISGVPVIAIAYEFKTEEVYQQMNLGAWVECIDDVTPKRLEEQIDRFMHRRESARSDMQQGVARQQEWARTAVSYLRETLSSAR